MYRKVYEGIYYLCRYDLVGGYDGQGTPVPIPNTVVKLFRADNTQAFRPRKDRSLPTHKNIQELRIWVPVFLYNCVRKVFRS